MPQLSYIAWYIKKSCFNNSFRAFQFHVSIIDHVESNQCTCCDVQKVHVIDCMFTVKNISFNQRIKSPHNPLLGARVRRGFDWLTCPNSRVFDHFLGQIPTRSHSVPQGG